MRRRLVLAVLSAVLSQAVAAMLVPGCLPGSGPALLPPDDGSGTSTDLDGDGGFLRSDVDLGDSFQLQGVTPSHGPFSGGTRVVLTGRGFSSKLRVFVGGIEVPQGNVIASDPTRAAIITPAGPAGDVEVRIRDEATAKERRLDRGFTYDALVVRPDSGATSGGTRIVIVGSGTTWDAGASVQIGGVPCNDVLVSSPTKLECVTAPGSPGVKDVVVVAKDGTGVQAREAFTYSDTTDGYRGGLSGGAFAGRVRVLARSGWTGAPIAGATVIAGSSLPAGVVRTTGATGVAEVSNLPGSSVTVTVAAKCHQPVTFVAVPVDTVTAYLSPVLDPSCAPEGDPPSTGGRGGRAGGIVEGQLAFPGSAEFKRQGWTTIPMPTRPTERRAAYAFEASGSPAARFELPPADAAVTPDSPGSTGYQYSLPVTPGNVTLYVVAGLEDRSETPPRFVPYAMGVARGVTVPAQTRVTGVDVMMDVLFDKQVTMAPLPPAPGPRGPDRFAGGLAVTLATNAYAILPRGLQTVALPAPPTLPFVGVPSLDRALAGEQYVLSAVAATGADLSRPASFVSRVRTSNANDPIVIGGFLGVPVLSQPGTGSWSGTRVEFGGASGPASLTLVSIVSGSGLVSWTIVAPGAATAFDLPDLSALPGPDNVGLVRGPIQTTVYVARIDDFDYGRLRYGQLSQSAWNAAAYDGLSGAY